MRGLCPPIQKLAGGFLSGTVFVKIPYNITVKIEVMLTVLRRQQQN